MRRWRTCWKSWCVKLLPDVKARFYNSTIQMWSPRTITSMQTLFAIMLHWNNNSRVVWVWLSIHLCQWPICENIGPWKCLTIQYWWIAPINAHMCLWPEEDHANDASVTRSRGSVDATMQDWTTEETPEASSYLWCLQSSQEKVWMDWNVQRPSWLSETKYQTSVLHHV